MQTQSEGASSGLLPISVDKPSPCIPGVPAHLIGPFCIGTGPACSEIESALGRGAGRKVALGHRLDH